jgi:RNA polymerase sigma-B factor
MRDQFDLFPSIEERPLTEQQGVNPVMQGAETEETALTSDTHVARLAELERFREYRRTGDSRIRDELVQDGQGIVVGLARRFRDRGAELDDLVQVAQIGLLHAIERFDPERGVPFIGFATPTVLGELRRHFRGVWSVKVPRSLQEATQRLRPAVGELQHELGRSPTMSEIADRLGISIEQVIEAIDASSAFRVRSIDVPLSSEAGGSSLASSLADVDAGDGFARVDAKEYIDKLLPILSPRSRRIIELRFYENLSQTEIGELVGMSQMHVSRLLRQALLELGSIIDAQG